MKPFTPKLSRRLDRAIIGTESGSRFWRLVKRLLEWHIFGGRL